MEVRASLVVLGGGAVGCELAQFFARVGTRVTLVQTAARLLPRVDADAGAIVGRIFAEDGIDVRLGATVASVEPGVRGTLEGGETLGARRGPPATGTYERPRREGFLKLAGDPERRVLVGAVAVGPEAGEWLQQVTLAIRAEVPLEVLLDTIQPYPTFSEAVFLAARELGDQLRP